MVRCEVLSTSNPKLTPGSKPDVSTRSRSRSRAEPDPRDFRFPRTRLWAPECPAGFQDPATHSRQGLNDPATTRVSRWIRVLWAPGWPCSLPEPETHFGHGMNACDDADAAARTLGANAFLERDTFTSIGSLTNSGQSKQPSVAIHRSSCVKSSSMSIFTGSAVQLMVGSNCSVRSIRSIDPEISKRCPPPSLGDRTLSFY